MASGVKKQLAVALDDVLRDNLSASAEHAGHSLAEEVRRRLELTFQIEKERSHIHPATRQLMTAVGALADLVHQQTGHHWYDHPAANRILRAAIVSRLTRLSPGSADATFASEEATQQIIISSSPEMIGTGLEAVEFSARTHPSNKEAT